MRCLVLGLLLGLATMACTSGGDVGSTPTPTTGLQRGGALRLALVYTRPVHDFFVDPQRAYDFASWEILRCCLARTLMSYNGLPAAQGGAEARPDLAVDAPEVSTDGLTWTFRLKPGVRYAPPFADAEVVAADIIRGIERTLTPAHESTLKFGRFLGTYEFYYRELIQGGREFANGTADSISGLETPDSHTLIVHLTQPAGDLAYRLTLPATAPIPPNPSAPDERLGAAEGHEHYGRFIVTSGPYMLAGSADLNLAVPTQEQRPPSGFTRRSVTLVRNPSWDQRLDDLRPAYVDEIVLSVVPDLKEAASEVDAGELDFFFDAAPPLDQIRRYQNDPALRDRLRTFPSDFQFVIPMNVAVPPFDDIHVRKAVNYAIDKEALRRLMASEPMFFGAALGEVHGHIAPDGVERNLLLGQDFYPHDLDRARAEMVLSHYDQDGDGVCDAPACRDIPAQTWDDGPLPEVAARVGRDLARIGLGLTITFRSQDTQLCNVCIPPEEHVPLTIGELWPRDYPNGSTFFVPSFSGSVLEGTNENFSLLGATPEQLRGWGYDVTEVPSVDDRIDACVPLVGTPQVECWAELDQYLMTEVVPWAPYQTIDSIVVLSARVRNYHVNEFSSGFPAIDQIVLAPSV